MPLDLVLGDCYIREEALPYHEFVYERGQRIQTISALARECMKTQAEVRAFRYDSKVKGREYHVGQMVWYFYPRRKQGLKEKWMSFYVGPYRIEKRVGPVLYQIRKTPRSQAKLIYVDKLKPFLGPIPAVWGGEASEEVIAPFIPEEIGEEDEEREYERSRPARRIRPPNRYGFDD